MFRKMLGQRNDQNSKGKNAAEEMTVAPEAVAAESKDDDAERRALASRVKASVFGEIINLLMRSPRHNMLRLKDLEHIVLPAILTNQYSIAKVKPKDNPNAAGIPAGVAFWARLSDDLDRKLTEKLDEPLRLGPNDWLSGDNYWLLDIVGPPKIAAAMLDQLNKSVFAGKRFKVRGVKDGKVLIDQFEGAELAAS